jgi:2-phospho-L-lactate guanylyltransferase (CobY/MobA/RfbA family)
VLQLQSIGLDVDNPADLHQLISRPGETRTQQLLRRWKLEGHLLASAVDSL